ncbi:hypothetical protein FOPG_20080 [Fusarium oxysporum f. sp. conglutinans race 2 54008]|uniref:Uncharacterized protein n=1 Tax=Fusarium oxysporum f. sp. conglutinans race 2 54008 TaxID=1089457 RepID=X0GJ13_FUSOX|nr:hypothetical protein FOPG_20080 [Fusarium oxysporum f. sp. conglutinans race 2 54008]
MALFIRYVFKILSGLYAGPEQVAGHGYELRN